MPTVVTASVCHLAEQPDKARASWGRRLLPGGGRGGSIERALCAQTGWHLQKQKRGMGGGGGGGGEGVKNVEGKQGEIRLEKMEGRGGGGWAYGGGRCGARSV